MFLVKNARPDLAKLAYVDRRAGGRQAPLIVKEGYGEPLVPWAPAVVVAPVADTTTGGGIFAMFKSYNRKPSATNSTTATSTSADAATATSANAAAATDTHFVYLGTMQDYKATRDKSKRRSPTSTGSGSGSSVGGEEAPYVNVKYAEFKSRSKL
jgi:hypothetical protein